MDNTWALAQMNLANGNVITDYWPNQAAQFNYGLEVLKKDGFDWALIVDADEFYAAVDIGRLIGEIRNVSHDTVALCAPDMSVYWKTPDYRIIPRQEDAPVIAIRTSAKFKDKRHIDGDHLIINSQSELHHMSYVRSDQQMFKKINTFEHSHEFDTYAWMNEVWLPWIEQMENLHPVAPKQFKRAIYHPAPQEIRRLINWDS